MARRYLWRDGSPLFTAKVSGESMSPALHAGDWVAVSRIFHPRRGLIVLLRDPRDGRQIVKRLAGRRSSGWWVLGDNLAASTDSRTFGPVPEDLLAGRVLLRYHRADR